MNAARVRKVLGNQADSVLHQLHLAGLVVVSEAEHTEALRKAAAYDRLRTPGEASSEGGPA